VARWLNDVDPQTWLANVLAHITDHPVFAAPRASAVPIGKSLYACSCCVNIQATFQGFVTRVGAMTEAAALVLEPEPFREHTM
jgi:hypothetical protein